MSNQLSGEELMSVARPVVAEEGQGAALTYFLASLYCADCYGILLA